MKTKEFLLKLADLFLLSDKDTEKWVQVPSLRHTWYWFFFAIFVRFVFDISVRITPLYIFVENSETFTLAFRMINLAAFGIAAVAVIVLAAYYYRYVLSEGIPINLNSVTFIYFVHVVMFGLIYHFSYVIAPTAFQYSSPPIQIKPTLMANSGGLLLMRVQFIVFSACQSLNVDYFKITPRSSIFIILGLVQSIFTLVLIALVVSSYVAQRISKKL